MQELGLFRRETRVLKFNSDALSLPQPGGSGRGWEIQSALTVSEGDRLTLIMQQIPLLKAQGCTVITKPGAQNKQAKLEFF